MSVNGTTGFTDLVGVGNGEICVGVGVGCATGVELLMVGVADPEWTYPEFGGSDGMPFDYSGWQTHSRRGFRS